MCLIKWKRCLKRPTSLLHPIHLYCTTPLILRNAEKFCNPMKSCIMIVSVRSCGPQASVFLIDSVSGTHTEKDSYSYISVSLNYFQHGHFNKGIAILKPHDSNTLFHMFPTHTSVAVRIQFMFSV